MNLKPTQESGKNDEEIICPFAEEQHRWLANLLIGLMFITPVIIVLYLFLLTI